MFAQNAFVRRALPEGLLLLAARIAAGGVYWRSGQTKLEGFGIADSTYFLFREEYRLLVIPPEIAAVLATITENACSALLVVGLASRLSAAALLAVTAVIQVFVYPQAWPDHLLWAVALLVVISHGPGLLSLDALLARSDRPGRSLPAGADGE